MGRNIEAYIDDTVIKSKVASKYLQYLVETFSMLWKHQLQLNTSKCSFRVGLGKFLGFIITHRGIEVNLNQIKAINDLRPPQNPKEV